MCPIDFEVKRSKVKVTMHKLLKMVSFLEKLSPRGYLSRKDSPDLVFVFVTITCLRSEIILFLLVHLYLVCYCIVLTLESHMLVLDL